MYLKTFILFWLGVFICTHSFSLSKKEIESVDSLKQILRNDSNHANFGKIYHELAETYYYCNLDSSIHYANLYLKLSEKTHDTSGMAEAQNGLAYAYDKNGEILLALEYFQKALDNYIALKDTYYIAASYCNIGYMTSYGADQAKGLNYFLESMKIAEEIQDSGLISDVSTNIGYYYDRVGDNTAALRYYQKSLDIDLEIADSIVLALSYTNISSMNFKTKHYSLANQQLAEAKNLVSKSHTLEDLAYLWSSLTECYIEMKMVDSASYYLGLSEKIILENKLPVLMPYLYEQKGNLAYLKKEYKNCLNYLDTSIVLFNNINTIEPFLDIYKLRAAACASLNKHKEAYKTLQMANTLNDSLGYGILANMLGEFEQDRIYKIELDKSKLKAQLENEKHMATKLKMQANFRIALFSIILLILIIIGVIYFLKKKREQNKILEINNSLIKDQKLKLENYIEKLELSETNFKELNATKDKFFSIIGHDLKNPFSSIAGLTQILIDDEHKRKSNDLLKILDSLNKTANYGFSLLENLLSWAQSQTGSLKPKQQSITYNILLEMVALDLNTQAKNKNISVQLKNIDPSIQVIADVNMLTTILRNLIHNAIKFSFENSKIFISIEKKDKHLITCVEDFGLGIEENKISELFNLDRNFQENGTKNEKGTGLGLMLCKEFIAKNDGEIWVKSSALKGSKFYFSIPLKN